MWFFQFTGSGTLETTKGGLSAGTESSFSSSKDPPQPLSKIRIVAPRMKERKKRNSREIISSHHFPEIRFTTAAVILNFAIIIVENSMMIAGNMADFSVMLSIRNGNDIMRIAFSGF
jgi:hypothetical protein